MAERADDPRELQEITVKSDTRDVLAHSARYVEKNRLDEVLIVDIDAHVTETAFWSEIVERIGAVYALEPVERTSAPASVWRYADGAGEIGVVASVSQSFCDTCDRVRMTADGQFRNCLFATEETDLRGLIRGGASDDEVAEVLERTVAAKWAGHRINQVRYYSFADFEKALLAGCKSRGEKSRIKKLFE